MFLPPAPGSPEALQPGSPAQAGPPCLWQPPPAPHLPSSEPAPRAPQRHERFCGPGSGAARLLVSRSLASVVPPHLRTLPPPSFPGLGLCYSSGPKLGFGHSLAPPSPPLRKHLQVSKKATELSGGSGLATPPGSEEAPQTDTETEQPGPPWPGPESLLPHSGLPRPARPTLPPKPRLTPSTPPRPPPCHECRGPPDSLPKPAPRPRPRGDFMELSGSPPGLPGLLSPPPGRCSEPPPASRVPRLGFCRSPPPATRSLFPPPRPPRTSSAPAPSTASRAGVWRAEPSPPPPTPGHLSRDPARGLSAEG